LGERYHLICPFFPHFPHQPFRQLELDHRQYQPTGLFGQVLNQPPPGC
jgi:hypothetical protein